MRRWSPRSFRAGKQTEQRLKFCDFPDSSTSTCYPPHTNESDENGVGHDALIDRAYQQHDRDQSNEPSEAESADTASFSLWRKLFFILPTIDKGFSALVAGLAFGLYKPFPSVCFFTFGTEEDARSGRDFLASLHFIPRCPHGLPWHACVENYKRLVLNKTQLSSAENILQSSARCKSFSPFCLVTALRSVIRRSNKQYRSTIS